jgi:hypothetical protein
MQAIPSNPDDEATTFTLRGKPASLLRHPGKLVEGAIPDGDGVIPVGHALRRINHK